MSSATADEYQRLLTLSERFSGWQIWEERDRNIAEEKRHLRQADYIHGNLRRDYFFQQYRLLSDDELNGRALESKRHSRRCHRLLDDMFREFAEMRLLVENIAPMLLGALPVADRALFETIDPATMVQSFSEVRGQLLAQGEGSTSTHSMDFRSVNWFGTIYEFTQNQAAIVSRLWEAWESGSPVVGDEALREAADCSSERLDLVFRDSPAWGTMIVPGQTRGSRRLSPPG